MTFFCLYVLFRFALPFLFCLHVFVVLAKKIVVFVILFLNVFFIDYFSVFYYFCLLCICTCCCFLFVFQMSPSKRSTHKWLPHLRMSPILISLITLTSSSCHNQASKKVIVVASKAKQVDSQESCTTQMHSLHHGLLKIEISRQFIFLKSPEIFSESIVKLFKNK